MKPDFVEFVSNKMNKEIKAIYLTGSEINDLNVKETADKDLFIFVQDSKDDIINNRLFSKQFNLEFKGTEYDIKAYDFRKLYSLIKKSNFNILEVFGTPPLYYNNNEFVKIISNKQSWGSLACFNLNSLVKSLTGITFSTLKRIKNKGIDSKDAIKSMTQAFKCQQYILDLFNFVNFETKFPFDLHVSKLEITNGILLKDLKQSAYDNHLDKKELDNCFNALCAKVNFNNLYVDLLTKNSEEVSERVKPFKEKLESALATELSKSLC